MFIYFFSKLILTKLAAFGTFSYYLNKNAYISAHRQNKHMLWVFIVLVGSQGLFFILIHVGRLFWLASLDLQTVVVIQFS